MAAQIVPLTSAPNQQLSVSLSINGGTVPLQLYVYFNEMAGFWLMDISDQFGSLILGSVPFTTGFYPAANILAPFQSLGIGSAFIINASGVANDYPSGTQLGSDFVLLWDDSTNNLPNVYPPVN
jgi:hypothetical protein